MDEQTESFKKTFDKLKLIISESLVIDIELIKLDSDLSDLIEADSYNFPLYMMELVRAIEEAFNVEISDEDAEKIFTTVKNVLCYLYFNDAKVEQSEIQKIIDREITEIKRQEEEEIKTKIIKIINFINNSPIEEQKILEIIENHDFINYEEKIINFFNVLNQPRTSPTEIIEFVDILNNHFFVNNLEYIRKILSFLDTSSISREQLSQLIRDDQIQSHLNKVKQIKDLIKQKSIEIENKITEKKPLQNQITTLQTQIKTLRDQVYSLEQELKSLYTE